MQSAQLDNSPKHAQIPMPLIAAGGSGPLFTEKTFSHDGLTRRLSVREAVDHDAAQLAPILRPADRQELKALTVEAPLEALVRGIRTSRPCYALADQHDGPLALFGVMPDEQSDRQDAGMVWMLGAVRLEEYAVTFLRHCRPWITHLHDVYRVLWNYVDARNELHIQWLKWCGFRFLRRIESYGVEERPFHEFESIRGSNMVNEEFRIQ